MQQLALSWEPERRTYRVSELSARLRALVDAEFGDVWVAGEISGCRQASSGHCYFTLKDEQAQLKCVCFRGSLRYLKFKPQDGMEVLARGRLDIYEQRGEYQLLVETLEPQGHGALQLAFEQLKKKLAGEGLFEGARKRPLPALPRRIGIVTSPTGAVIQDFLQILLRRFPGVHVRLYPAQVQGEGAVEAVCRGIEHFSAAGWAEVLVVARGGGSLEDLWTFNEEAVARAIAASRIPVVSAIGHETDFTIADFAADLRAPTPSAAAELVICTQQQVLDGIDTAGHKLLQSVRYRLAMLERRLNQQGTERARAALLRRIGRSLQRIDELEYCFRDHMRESLKRSARELDTLALRLGALDLRLRFAEGRKRLDAMETRLAHSAKLLLARAHGRLDPLQAHLTQLSPLKILERGYAIVTNEAGEIVKRSEAAPPGTAVEVRLAEGKIAARVTEPPAPASDRT